MSELGRGASDLGRAFAFVRARSHLWKWLVAPALVTLVLIVGIVIGVSSLADPVVAWAAAHVPSFLAGIVGTLVRIVVIVALGIGGVLVFVALAAMIAGPFNELLSEAVEEELTGTPGPPFTLGGFVTEAARGIAHAVRRLVLALVGAVLLFALGFVPVVGPFLALAIGGYLAASGAAYDAYDAVLARRRLAYQAKLDYLRAIRGRSLGLGLAVTGLLFIPVVNLVALGLGAVGATLAVHERRGQGPAV